MSQRNRAWLGFAFWAVPQLAVFIWTAILYGQFRTHNLVGIDYSNDTANWFRCFIPYFLIREFRRYRSIQTEC
jgi:hypothetical protein